MRRSDRGPSPAMIRSLASHMVRQRTMHDAGYAVRPYRQPEPGETPLSPDERWHGVVHGLIRAGLSDLGGA